VKAIQPNAFLDIKKQFFKRYIVFKLKILLQFFRFENELFLQKINKRRKNNDSADNIPDKMRQMNWFCVLKLSNSKQ